ncbi:oxygen-independent coproporphyrinogen-III oxidase-like protein YqeR [Candidatus Phycosocius bacilliformis]|uniref:Heme chaperone HemW n=1 Tax=Candidatus Phycosocius bacilliformis TaxID=1445552 RepID=A0A2P2E6M2_9PROT|nr:radical SAM family heme chaperone HemW [Candidatus Phycosocius bacilliformis]GBF56698.1 oxygen-independent coproporphyrinogen-III oxidase-like protein YqeR [Candidatus Phycosocius bacilliformis]
MTHRQLGLYIHWPYCAAICPYCDFNVYRARGADTAPLVDAILADLAYWRAQTGPRPLASLFFGGGTPSLMDPADVARVIETADRLWDLEASVEISLEANPTDAEAARFADLRAAGVERLSLGVQALDDPSLKALGRFHSAAEAMAAADLARQLFPRLSIDLIYARQDQTLAAWQDELMRALALNPDHVSPYQLTIEPGTAFARAAARGRLKVPDPDLAADFYTLTQDVLEGVGFDAYEVSNHARGHDNRSRHNLLYWRSQDWIGVGPGAHGRLGWGGERRASKALDRPRDYVDQVTARGHAIDELETLSPEAVRDEFWLMGLRLQDGLPLADAPRPALSDNKIRRNLEHGWMWQSDTHLGLTAQGRLLADAVIGDLLAD